MTALKQIARSNAGQAILVGELAWIPTEAPRLSHNNPNWRIGYE
ncbi:hypothetical protein BPTFM16_01632 [Altererythrobacter insulae]|nr:hypothetical protein BPTFM16_01632 [Altererythrobacter insulae]